MSKYFVNLSPNSIVHRNGKPSVDLRSLPTEATCKKLYLEGFRHIGITEEAKVLFKKCPVVTLERLIEQKTKEGKKQEVEILTELLKAKKKPKNDTKRVSKS